MTALTTYLEGQLAESSQLIEQNLSSEQCSVAGQEDQRCP